MTEDEREYHRMQYAEQVADAAKRIEYANKYAQDGLKALLLANGGALIALFTFIGRTGVIAQNQSLIWWAFACFSVGLALTLVAHIGAHISQNHFYLASQAEAWNAQSALTGKSKRYNSDRPMTAGNYFQAAAVLLAITALMAFVTGSGVALAGLLPG